MTEPPSEVYVVDDDPGMLRSVVRLLRASGIEARGFASGAAFLDEWTGERGGCLVADMWMPGMTGAELQAALEERGADLPVVFMSARPLVPDVVKAMQRGAIDFLEKPFAEEELVSRVVYALELSARRRSEAAQHEALRARLETLTERERAVLDQLLVGKSAKQIAADWQISGKTVHVHRANVLEKLQVVSEAELILLLRDVKA